MLLRIAVSSQINGSYRAEYPGHSVYIAGTLGYVNKLYDAGTGWLGIGVQLDSQSVVHPYAAGVVQRDIDVPLEATTGAKLYIAVDCGDFDLQHGVGESYPTVAQYHPYRLYVWHN